MAASAARRCASTAPSRPCARVARVVVTLRPGLLRGDLDCRRSVRVVRLRAAGRREVTPRPAQRPGDRVADSISSRERRADPTIAVHEDTVARQEAGAPRRGSLARLLERADHLWRPNPAGRFGLDAAHPAVRRSSAWPWASYHQLPTGTRGLDHVEEDREGAELLAEAPTAVRWSQIAKISDMIPAELLLAPLGDVHAQEPLTADALSEVVE